MSKKEMTIGEEFENFMSFAMRYNYKKKDIRKKKKEKNLLTPSEVTKDSSPYRKRLGIRAVC